MLISGCEWVVLCVPDRQPVLLCINKRRCAPFLLLCLPLCTDEYKMKGVEKVKYISGEEGGVDGQDSTVCDLIVFSFFVFNRAHLLCLRMASVGKKKKNPVCNQTKS